MNTEQKKNYLFRLRMIRRGMRLLNEAAGLLLLEEPETFPVIADTNEDASVIEVSVLKKYDSDVNSYIEVRVDKAHPLYERFFSAISMLNMTGDDDKHKNLGQRIAETTYVVELNEDEHKQLIS